MTTPSSPEATDTTGINLAMVTIDCDDAHTMAVFWSSLLDGTIEQDQGDYSMVKAGDATLGFGRIPDYVPPAWPDDGHKQFHLDLAVTDLDAATERALALGATRAAPPDGAHGEWVVMLDPAGHPFCLAVWG